MRSVRYTFPRAKVKVQANTTEKEKPLRSLGLKDFYVADSYAAASTLAEGTAAAARYTVGALKILTYIIRSARGSPAHSVSDDQVRTGRVLMGHSIVHDFGKVIGIQQGALIFIGIQALAHLRLGSGGRNARRVDAILCPAFGCHQHRCLCGAVLTPGSMGLQSRRRVDIDDLQIGIVFESQLGAIDGTGEIDVDVLLCVLQICFFDGAGHHIARIVDKNIGDKYAASIIAFTPKCVYWWPDQKFSSRNFSASAFHRPSFFSTSWARV